MGGVRRGSAWQEERIIPKVQKCVFKLAGHSERKIKMKWIIEVMQTAGKWKQKEKRKKKTVRSDISMFANLTWKCGLIP